MDMNDRALRHLIIVGLGGIHPCSIPREDGFNVPLPASEMWPSLCLARDLDDPEAQAGQHLYWNDPEGQAVSPGILHTHGAMAVLLKNVKPNLVQTPNNPVIMHGDLASITGYRIRSMPRGLVYRWQTMLSPEAGLAPLEPKNSSISNVTWRAYDPKGRGCWL